MRKEKWVLRRRGADYKAIGERLGTDPLIVMLARNRGYETEEDIGKYIRPDLKDLYDPHLMGEIDLAADVICEKIESNLHIRVIGDYDIDGIMSTYILSDAITSLGGNVDHVLPHRVKDGYGLNDDLIKEASADGVDTIITCDNGISAYNQAVLAQDMEITLVITDHHEVPYRDENGNRELLIPPADAVVNPKIPGCGYPFQGICGAVVALKFVQVLYESMGRDPREAMGKYLPMAAIATIGDVMDLVDENRIIVKHGLDALTHTDNYGIKELIRVCGLMDRKLTAYSVGFVLGPCLNAAGRLDSAERSLSLLFAPTSGEAAAIAVDLKELNESRKTLTEKGVMLAETIVEREGDDRRVLVLYLPDIHESIAGIIAGRIREKYIKPVFVLTDSEGILKGSGRSIPAYSMFDEMVKCADLFLKYGGHPMAGGLSMEKDKLPEFMERIESLCTLTEDDLYEEIIIDAQMPFDYAGLNVVNELSVLEPFGNGNRKPLFARKGVRLLEHRIFGKNRNVGKYTVTDENNGRYELTWFGDQDDLINAFSEKKELSIAYYPDINVYNGNTSVQLVVKHYA